MKNLILSEKLENRIAELPDNPGVYIMKNADGEVIYVGKARNLKKRVRQYFGSQENKHVKVSKMASNVDIFEYIITDTELEALILECNLIKQYQPHYNILLRDDKHYPYVRINMNEKYPRVEIVRKVQKDGAKYFGPYSSSHAVREALDAVYKLFPVRSCKRDLSKPRAKNARACQYAQMGRCLAPCVKDVSEKEYDAMLKEVMELLSGKYTRLISELTRSMKEASDNLDFETAAVFRDKINAIKRLSEKQNADSSDFSSRDVFAAALENGHAVIQAFFMRDGKLSNTRKFDVEYTDESESEIIEEFLKRYFTDNPDVPPKILVSCEISGAELISEWLTSIRGKKAEVICPKKGSGRALVNLAKQNAEDAIKNSEDLKKREYDRKEGALKNLAEALGIDRKIVRMECYDISNTQGTDSVASMVVSINGVPTRSEYRRFRIKTVEGANDFASMAEVLTRRLLRGFEAGEAESGFGAMPDLLIVDGGKGQLSSAYDVLLSLGLENSIPLVGIAKREEELFLVGKSDPVVLPKNSNELRLITALRDEAHRFAITFHRSLREKRVITSELDGIKGVGSVRKAALIDEFGDVESIKNADIDDIMRVRGMNITTAREIYKHFHAENV